MTCKRYTLVLLVLQIYEPFVMSEIDDIRELVSNITSVNELLKDLIENYAQIKNIYEDKELEPSETGESEIDDYFKKEETGWTNSFQELATPMFLFEEVTPEPEINHSGLVYTNKKKKKAKRKVTTDPRADKPGHNELFRIELMFKTKNGTTPANLTNFDDTHSSETSDDLIPVKKTFVKKFRSPKHEAVKHVVQAEHFDNGKIWHEVVNRKPIQLTPLLKKVRAEFNKTGHKATLLIVKNNKKHNSSKKQKQLSKEYLYSEYYDPEDDPSSAEKIKNVELQMRILRQAYGYSCAKLVVKKCYKACKNANNNACRKSSCKKKFKKTFNNRAKTTCIQAFNASELRKSSREKSVFPLLTTRKPKKNFEVVHNINNALDQDKMANPKDDKSFKHKALSETINFADLTRGGLTAACFPHIMGKTLAERKQQQNSTYNTLNTLRDRLERECQREHSKRCDTACMGAFKSACDKYDCNKSKKKEYKKACRKDCKKIFGRDSDSSSSSSSSSSSYSDSDSDSSGSS